ncbi:MAG: hypothetical protein IH921_14245, partial [Gemmatimonadetes bacterium]|nr:hypothetical protein [Gemmatimonadota bacterium]
LSNTRLSRAEGLWLWQHWELIELGREISTHYACPLGQTLKAMTPESVRQGRGLQTVRYARLMRPIHEILDGSARVSPKRRAVIETLADAETPANAVQIAQAPRICRNLVAVVSSFMVSVSNPYVEVYEPDIGTAQEVRLPSFK